MKVKIIFLSLLILSIATMFYFYHMAVYFFHQVEAIPLAPIVSGSLLEQRSIVTNKMENYQFGVDISILVALVSSIGLIVTWIRGKIKKWRVLR